jgi:hypothetical protein
MHFIATANLKFCYIKSKLFAKKVTIMLYNVPKRNKYVQFSLCFCILYFNSYCETAYFC